MKRMKKYRPSFTLLLAASIAVLWLADRTYNELPNICTCEKKSNLVALPPSANLTSLVIRFGGVCHTPECITEYKAAFSNGSRRIPQIKHILWKTEHVSSYFARQLKTWTAIHPNWTYVLWRDSDIDKFMAKHYSALHAKFKSLPQHIMRVDMIRYFILRHFGGVYTDLDYVLHRPLDEFLKFPAVVARTTEVYAFHQLGMDTWPPRLLGSPGFMMSEPGHPFFHFCMKQLTNRPAKGVFTFAGPLALTNFLMHFAASFQISDNPEGVVLVPPSRNFESFKDNSLAGNKMKYIAQLAHMLKKRCNIAVKRPNLARNLIEYCKDVYNLDPITNRNEISYAAHDTSKSSSSYDSAKPAEFVENLVHIRSVIPNIVTADTLF